MDDRAAFMNAIIADIDNDLPRLVFADWLEEHGEADRAEFIRVQCELAALPADAPHHPQLAAREAELLARYGYEWAAAYRNEINHFSYRRGFIERAEVSVQRPASEILDVFSRIPIRHLLDADQLDELGNFADVLEQLPANRLTGLEFWSLYGHDCEGLRRVLESPALGNTRTFIFHHYRGGTFTEADDMIVRALHSPLRRNVEVLGINFDGCYDGPSAVVLEAIAESPYLRRLRSLFIPLASAMGRNVDSAAVLIERFGQSPNFEGLRHLDLHDTNFGEDSWREVLRWPFLPRLERLWLSSCELREGESRQRIEALPQWRTVFEQRCPNIDWDSQFVTLWDGEHFSAGLEWHNYEHPARPNTTETKREQEQPEEMKPDPRTRFDSTKKKKPNSWKK